MSYSLGFDDCIIRDSDKAIIPRDPGNRDYREYMQWVHAGNEPTPYTPPEVEPASPLELIESTLGLTKDEILEALGLT